MWKKNRGAGDIPLTASEIEAKYMENAAIAVTTTQAESIRDLILTLDQCSDVRMITSGLAGIERKWKPDHDQSIERRHPYS